MGRLLGAVVLASALALPAHAQQAGDEYTHMLQYLAQTRIGDDVLTGASGAIAVNLAAGDLNGDGVVDVSDLLILLGAWGPCSGGSCDADLNDDGTVDVSDLLALLANWG